MFTQKLKLCLHSICSVYPQFVLKIIYPQFVLNLYEFLSFVELPLFNAFGMTAS